MLNRITAEQKQNYQRDGFLVMNNFIESSVCDMLIERARFLIDNFEPEASKTVFSAKDQRHAKNNYFLESDTKIHFFYEEGALDESGQLTKDKSLCINKIGHALHNEDPVFNCFSRSHKIANVVDALGIQDPLLMQSMYICKQPFIGGEVTCHQDATYLYVKEQPVIGLWFALEDAILENGCMWAIPGGHQTKLKSRSIRDANDVVAIEVYDDSPWEMEKMVPLEVPRGSMIVLHGLLPHMSKENVSAKSRHAYSLHIVSGQHEYAEDNWIRMSKEKPARGFL